MQTDIKRHSKLQKLLSVASFIVSYFYCYYYNYRKLLWFHTTYTSSVCFSCTGLFYFFLFVLFLAKLTGNRIRQEGKQQALFTGTIMSNHFKKKRNFLYMQISSLSCAKVSNRPTQTSTQPAYTDTISTALHKNWNCNCVLMYIFVTPRTLTQNFYWKQKMW